jgi:hypothetical protein
MELNGLHKTRGKKMTTATFTELDVANACAYYFKSLGKSKKFIIAYITENFGAEIANAVKAGK